MLKLIGTQINVPRDSGTCTRCPMEVRLQHSTNSWRCQVSLRFESDASGRALTNIKEIPFGPALTDPNKVEDTLKRAQLAVLNPGVSDPTKFLDGLPGDVESQLEFSTNIVCVDIAGPEVTDLAFVNLPVGTEAQSAQHG